jgi:alpha-mannosidase
MSISKRIHIISNTHWDREWRFPFQETRLNLVRLIDELLDIMEQNPEYKYFHFDSQTIFLEDYLEYRPENKQRLEKLIRDERLIVGPWYTLPEEFSVSGESLVRNLLMGLKVGNSLGKTSKVGYTPTSYGQISQIAQIYAGFGIDGIIFYRGIHYSECTNEYFLESPDGSRILGIRLSRHVSRGAFFIYVSHKTMHNSDWDNFHWGDEGCLPFHLCRADEDHEEEPVLVKAPYKDTCNLDVVEEGIRLAMDDILSQATTDCLVLLDGMDSAFPNKNLPQIIKKANEVNSGWTFIHSSLSKFLKDLKSQINPDKLTVLKGERRHPSPDNMFNAFLKDSISSRMYLKQRNAEVERALIQWAEPFSCIAEQISKKNYPYVPLLKAWKYLLSCHPHDSISGLSPDQIHKDMMYRFDQAGIIANTLTKRALGEIIAQIDTSDANPEDIIITVFNPLPFERSTVVKVFVDFPREKGYRSISIYDNNVNKVSQQIISREDSYLIITEDHEVPMTLYTTKWKLAIKADNIPSLGYKTFIVKPENGNKSNYGSQITSANTMESEFLRVKVNSNGTISVVDKKSGEKYDNLLYFEDSGEAGDPWMHIPPFADKVYNTLGSSAQIRTTDDGPILTTIETIIQWALPLKLDREIKQRSKEEKEIIIVSKITLKKGDPKLYIQIEIDNTVKDHRLRVMFDSGFHPEKSIASGQFDVLERPVHLPDTSNWLEPMTGTNPHYGAVYVGNDRRGLAVLDIGLTEYEVLDNNSGTIAITLLRTFGYPKMSGLGKEDRVLRQGNEGSECLGKNKYELALFFTKGNWQSNGLLRQEREFKYPIIATHHSRYKGNKLQKTESFMKIEPEELILTAVKKSERNDSIIVRFYNPTDKELNGILWSKFPLKEAQLLQLNEDFIKELSLENENQVIIKAPGKKIITIGLGLKT